MSMDELAVMDGSKCILQLRGVRPFLSSKYDLTQHPNYRYTSDANPKYAFNIEKYLSTGLKLREDDAYAVYEVDVDEDEMEETLDEQQSSEAADEAAYP